MTELSVVVPVCNEAENVEPLAREIDAALRDRDYEMITSNLMQALKILKFMPLD